MEHDPTEPVDDVDAPGPPPPRLGSTHAAPPRLDPPRSAERRLDEPPAGPFGAGEIRRAFLRPDLAAEIVLARPDRLARTVGDGGRPARLAVLLLGASLVFAVPFGAVPPVGAFWKVAVLYTGSVLLCFPSLHVFGTFLGFRLSPEQNLVLALIVTATAALFSLALSPIAWFVDATTESGETGSPLPGRLAAGFLALGLVMGLVQLCRCIAAGRTRTDGRRGRSDEGEPGFVLLLAVWLILVVFITYRMGLWLGLLG